MTAPHPRTLSPANVSWEDGVPVAADYGDIYFSRRDGVAESRAVFLEGNDLPRRFAALKDDFCVAEIGFGTGLNFLLTRAAFLAAAAPSARMHYVSFERHPLSSADRRLFAAAVTAEHPQLGAALKALDAMAPPRLAGWHRRILDGGRVRLSLYLGDAAVGLADWAAMATGSGADAWFLDGFAPARNPELWATGLLAALPVLSRPGASIGTFSVAGAVRRGLTAAGFDVERVPGPLGKRQVLRGRLRAGLGQTAPARPERIRILGAGLAGACVAAACAARGIDVEVSDPAGAACTASGNPWAVLHPRLPLDDGPRGPLQAAAFPLSRSWIEAQAPGCWQPRAVIQLPEVRRPERLRRVLDRYRDSGSWLLPEPVADLTAIRFPDAGWADLPELVSILLDHPRIRLTRERIIEPVADGDDAAVVIAAGADSAALLPTPVQIGRMRGQLTRIRCNMPEEAAAWPIVTGRGHALPLADGWVCGASYVRDGATAGPTAEEREDNLVRLAQICDVLGLSKEPGDVIEEFVGVRSTVSDRSPLIGACAEAPGLWVSTGHASSGLLSCPLAAEMIAAEICAEPPVVDAEMRALLAPDRFH